MAGLVRCGALERVSGRRVPVAAREDLPLKCCSSLISRRARLARIFLLKTLVTFLMATPSPVWLLVAALQAGQHALAGDGRLSRTILCRRLPGLAPSLLYIDRPRRTLVRRLERSSTFRLRSGGTRMDGVGGVVERVGGTRSALDRQGEAAKRQTGGGRQEEEEKEEEGPAGRDIRRRAVGARAKVRGRR